MLKSMTGFGRGSASSGLKTLDVEIRTVNSRYFDANIRMPRSLFPLEEKLRKTINGSISRGKTDVFVTYRNLSGDSENVTVNEKLAEKYTESLKNLASRYNLQGGIDVGLIASLEGVIVTESQDEDMEEISSLLFDALKTALERITEMREAEGRNLSEDIMRRKSFIWEKLEEIEKLAPRMVPAYREKLKERLKELDEKFADDERVAMETAVFSDRASIDEEITRLKSHLSQIPVILKSDGPSGKKLDFLVQEMNREINTMASKSQDIEITGLVLEMKNETEKIREQIQNIE